MPAQASEELLTVPIALLEARPIDPKHRAYPLPPLASTGLEEDREIPVVTLENEFLIARVAIGLGGRLISLHDKRLDRDWLLPDSLPSQLGGIRGVSVPGGLEIRLHEDDRRNGMGFVRYQVVEPEEDDEPAGVWIAEIVTGTSLSFHAHWALAPDAPEVRLELRVFNRGFAKVPIQPRLWLPIEAPAMSGIGVPTRLGLLGVFAEHTEGADDPGRVLTQPTPGGSDVHLGEPLALWPRESATLQARIVPFPIPGALAAAPSFALGVQNGKLFAATARQESEGLRIDLATADGQTLSAPVQMDVRQPIELDLGDLAPARLAIVGADGAPQLLWDRAEAVQPYANPSIREPDSPPPLEGEGQGGGGGASLHGTEVELKRMSRQMPHKAAANSLLAIQSLRKADLEAADRYQETALNHNAEDVLGWWTLASIRQLLDPQREDAPELLNAHYLAPLEPVLRASSFLAQSEKAEGPNPLIEPLADVPDELIEVACRLIELGQLKAASRWLDEALQHVDLAMLRYLLACTLLEGSEYQAEAAQEVANAGKLGQSPAPWRREEWTAIEALAKRFPHDPYLPGLLQRRG